jgi:hypothetical protein
MKRIICMVLALTFTFTSVAEAARSVKKPIMPTVGEKPSVEACGAFVRSHSRAVHELFLGKPSGQEDEIKSRQLAEWNDAYRAWRALCPADVEFSHPLVTIEDGVSSAIVAANEEVASWFKPIEKALMGAALAASVLTACLLVSLCVSPTVKSAQYPLVMVPAPDFKIAIGN